MKSTGLDKVLCAAFSGLMLCSVVGSTEPPANSVTVIHNHTSGKSKAEISARGCLSMYIKVHDKVVLFDTGIEASSPLQNLDTLGLDETAVDAVVLSHEQPKQVHGLLDVLSANEMKPKVFVPAPAGEAISKMLPGANVVAVSKPVGVVRDAWLMGPLQSENNGEELTEQVLVIDEPSGLVIVAGCSHPDVVSIVKEVKAVFGARKVKMVAGGFHFQGTSRNEIKETSLGLQMMGINQLALCSCAGESALKIFRKEWGVRLLSFNEGDTVGF
jgi:7,8-dihydropterin-6-yl-methyl-4-(beta-D-ribofuranosyl)aminobenzene 5'-phosphate synthase